jgi:hypothetical protein
MCQCQEPGRRCSSWVSDRRLEAGVECGESGQVAIIVWVRLEVTAANEGVRGDLPAAAELRIALRQHSTLVEPAGLQDAPDLGEVAADIAHGAVKDDVPRQHIIEALVGEGQCVGSRLSRRQRAAASRRNSSSPRSHRTVLRTRWAAAVAID